ncbi:MAG: ABC transporter permease [Mariprofundus sp.]|nr:ABC transporter permease [Mariprofundus sp.]
MEVTQKRFDALHGRADRVGEISLRLVRGLYHFYLFMASLLALGLRFKWISRPAVVNVLIRQIYFTGVKGLPWVLVITLFAGVAAVYHIVHFAKSVGDISLIGSLMNTLLMQEIAPLLVTILMLTRSGVAVATEIGNMHIRGEALLLKSMGIDLNEYLYLPRMMAFTLCGLVMTMLFVGISVWVGGLFVALSHELNFNQFLTEIRKGITLDGVLMMVGKGAFYPVLCCAMLLFEGRKVGHDPNQVPVHATYGVLDSLMMVALVDVIVAVLRGLL